MHPMFAHWWKRASGSCGFGGAERSGHGCGPRGERHGGGHFFGEHSVHCGPGGWGGGGWGGGDTGGGGFGVRRPLRFLAHKLDLDDGQVAELARVLDVLKTERAQAEVDGRRTVTAFADAVAAGQFDEGKAGEGGELRVATAERLRQAVLKALRELHAILNDDQRKQLAYLIRTGAVTL